MQAKNVADVYPNWVIYILSPDTDVFLLAIYIYRKLSPKLVFRTGNARDIRDIDTGKVCNSLSANYTVATLGWHSVTGCDQTARFDGKLKNDFYKTFESASPEVLESLGYLGTDTSESSQVTVKGVHQFVIDTYSKSSNVTSLSEFRWKIFSQNQKSIENLPPTKDALHCKILRSHYIKYLLKSALLPVVCKRDPTLYGWYYDEGKLLNKLPAPTNMISLTISSCKSACNSNRCRCKKY